MEHVKDIEHGIQAGDRVRRDKVMGVKNVYGTVEKITSHYVIVIWDDINGHWHYTHEQSKTLEVVDEEIV